MSATDIPKLRADGSNYHSWRETIEDYFRATPKFEYMLIDFLEKETIQPPLEESPQPLSGPSTRATDRASDEQLLHIQGLSRLDRWKAAKGSAIFVLRTSTDESHHVDF